MNFLFLILLGSPKKVRIFAQFKEMPTMTLRTFLIAAILTFGVLKAAADDYPTISPYATFTKTDGAEETIYMVANDSESEDSEGASANELSASAPLVGRFVANPSNVTGWEEYYEWRFYKEGLESTPYLVRYEQDTDYTLVSSGSNRIVLYAVFTKGNEKVEYLGTTVKFWYGEDYEESPSGMEPFVVTISESKLEMPNAFSPNHDGVNDIYKAKSGHQSLIEFHAIIFNRWGQKLYEWNDPDGGWDGTYKGKDVKQGVYYVLVKARGADGRVFNIKRDVNLLRGYSETTGSTSTGGGED